MDKFNDMYAEPNYGRLFLLFFLFLASMFYYMTMDAYDQVSAWHIASDVVVIDTSLDN